MALPSPLPSPLRLRPRLRGRLPFVLALLAPLFLAACTNDTPVGLDLVGDEGGAPGQTVVPARSTTAAAQPDLMAGVLEGDTTRIGARRALVGRVTDPVLGTFETTALVDFFAGVAVASATVDSFRADRVRAATFVIRRDRYVTGDTTATVRLVLRPLVAEIPAFGGSTDTTYATGAPIATFAFAPTDTTVRVVLPASWVAANDTTLRSTAFVTSFKGFAIEAEATSGNAVRAFSFTGTRLEAVAGDDTVRFAAAKIGTLLRRTGTPAASPGRVVLQDGVPVAFDIAPRFDTLGVIRKGLARAAVVIDLDTLALRTPGFKRSVPAVELTGVDSKGNVVLTGGGNPRVRTVGIVRGGRLVFSSTSLTLDIQDALLGRTRTIVAFRLRTLTGPGTLDAAVLRTDGAFAPRLSLTLVDPS